MLAFGNPLLFLVFSTFSLSQASPHKENSLFKRAGVDPEQHYAKDKDLKILFDGKPLPKLLVFELSKTLWSSAMIGGVPDSKLFAPAVEVLQAGKAAGVKLAIASYHADEAEVKAALARIWIPRMARVGPVGKADDVSSQTALSMFQHVAIGQVSSQKTHFETLRAKTKIPYTEMLFFFPTEITGITEALGVTVLQIDPAVGMTRAAVKKGIEKWRSRAKEGQPQSGGNSRKGQIGNTEA